MKGAAVSVIVASLSGDYSRDQVREVSDLVSVLVEIRIIRRNGLIVLCCFHK